jgi:DNA polymerase I/DNA polymerase-2
LKLPALPDFPLYEVKEILGVENGYYPELKLLAFDIEYVDGQIVLISLAENDQNPIVLAAGKAEGADREFENEKELLLNFLQIVQEKDPDILIGYNSDGFDLDVIKEKLKAYRIKEPFLKGGGQLTWVRRGRGYAGRIDGVVHLDLFAFVQNILAPQLQSEILTLNEVASEIVGEGKEDISYEKIIMLWREGPRSELVEYSRNDARITYLLAKALLPQILALANISGETPFDTVRETFGLLVDNYLVKKTRDFNAVALNLPKQEEINERRRQEPYTGGYVIEPKPGLHTNLAVFDFRSLYPSIIVTFNISPETLNCRCCKDSTKAIRIPEKDYWFCGERKGFISACVEEVLKQRFELKEKLKTISPDNSDYVYVKEMQGALKVLANASYGYLAYAGARWYCRECAESSAALGRHFIKKAVEMASTYGEVVYGDTDSLFVKIDSPEVATEFVTQINNELPGILELELQGIYIKGLFSFTREGRAAKKRYALLDESGNLTIRGFEAIRKDWCELAKELQMKVLRLVMLGNIEEAVKEVREVIAKVRNREVDVKELSMVAQLGKELHEYRVKTPHSIAAKKLIEKGYDITRGEQIRYVIVSGQGSIADRAEPLEFVNVADYDVDYYLEHQIYPAALRVLEAVGYSKASLDKGVDSSNHPSLF